jgi:hypothetical protein
MPSTEARGQVDRLGSRQQPKSPFHNRNAYYHRLEFGLGAIRQARSRASSASHAVTLPSRYPKTRLLQSPLPVAFITRHGTSLRRPASDAASLRSVSAVLKLAFYFESVRPL